MAKKFGMTHLVNPREIGNEKAVQAIQDLTDGGLTIPSTLLEILELCVAKKNGLL
jgi:Zn-dependent alcohol dehydrogenase